MQFLRQMQYLLAEIFVGLVSLGELLNQPIVRLFQIADLFFVLTVLLKHEGLNLLMPYLFSVVLFPIFLFFPKPRMFALELAD